MKLKIQLGRIIAIKVFFVFSSLNNSWRPFHTHKQEINSWNFLQLKLGFYIIKVSVKGKWNKKRSCMESELSDFEKKLNNIKQEMSEEDIISSELETR